MRQGSSQLFLNLQLYFEKIMELVTSGTDSKLLNDAVRSLATDSGIHPLVPYFIQFIEDEVRTFHCLFSFCVPLLSLCFLSVCFILVTIFWDALLISGAWDRSSDVSAASCQQTSKCCVETRVVSLELLVRLPQKRPPKR